VLENRCVYSRVPAEAVTTTILNYATFHSYAAHAAQQQKS